MKMEADTIPGEVFSRVLEQLAFIFAEPAPKDRLPVPQGDCLITHMKFSGALQGALWLAVPGALCLDLAANMLGTDPEDDPSPARGLDALKELLNVVCGNILTELAGSRPVFVLSIPEHAALGLPAWTDFLQQPDTRAFMVDEHPALLRLQLESEPA